MKQLFPKRDDVIVECSQRKVKRAAVGSPIKALRRDGRYRYYKKEHGKKP